MFSTSGPVPASTTRTPSIISSGVVITGVLSSSGDIQVDGHVDGDVRCVNLTVGAEGIIRGEVRAETVVVRGTVDGRIAARSVMVANGGHMEGDILHQTLEVEPGAFVEGHFRHAADALAEKLPEEDADGSDRRRPGSPMRAVEDTPIKIAAAE